MKISVMSLFRDSEDTIHSFLKRLEDLENFTNAAFEYYFYENDSTDSTLEILKAWMAGKAGNVFSEKLNTPKFGSVTSEQRVQLMSYYRNKLLYYVKPISSDYSIVVDSDVVFAPNIVNDYLKYFSESVSMLTSNCVQNISCKMCDCGKPSYYDSWALIDRYGNFGLTWSCNPFVVDSDRKLWENNEPVEVYCAFSGLAMIKSEYLNKVRWAINRNTCEHWGLCDGLNRFGKVLAIPKIITNVHIPESITSNLNYNRVVNNQKEILNKVHTINGCEND